MSDVWENCVYLKNGQDYHIEENLKGQREIWIEKITEIFKESDGKNKNNMRNLLTTHR
ncbi:unnamed protein product [Meloidogyne enterolobii]|uniref:Uncharacterized protein n=1 Tax=Meloidogyne enterolobii TaxID=390850 RepID=A0ACB1AHJ0_MELEN